MPALPNRVEITTNGNYREFRVDSSPDHSHGLFPNPGNPHEITPQADFLENSTGRLSNSTNTPKAWVISIAATVDSG